MNPLDFDIKDSIPHIIDAWAEVYGTEHKELLKQREHRNFYVIYNNIDGIEDYIEFLKDCKQKELAIKFLNKIGINTSKFKQESYAEDLDENINKLIEVFIGDYRNIGPINSMLSSDGINAWDFTDEKEKTQNVEEKIKFLNIIRGKNAEPITKETYGEFCNTNEYNKLKRNIEVYKKFYEQNIQEYEEYIKELEPYEEYVSNEKNRKKEIEKNKRTELYYQIEEILPNDIKDKLHNECFNIEEKKRMILGTIVEGKLGVKSYIEYFSQKDEEKLKDPLINEDYKNYIYSCRINYIKQMGNKTGKELSDFENCKEFYKYLIKQKEVKKLIVPTKIANEITKLRERAYEESQRDFVYNSKDFIENTKQFDNDEDSKEAIFEVEKQQLLCIARATRGGKFAPVVFLSILKGIRGDIAIEVLHELGHSFEAEGITGTNCWRSGFENGDPEKPKNPYNNEKRKYERFNETIHDMLTMEANEVLHKKGIYLFERKELTIDAKDINTSNICKSLLTRFLGKYRKEIIDVLLFGDMEHLHNKVGKENFEELVDILNKVDSLENCENLELTKKLKNNEKDHPDVIEYYRQLEKLEKVYDDMEKHISTEDALDILNSAVQATEEKTRMGQIQGVKEKLKNIIEKIKGKIQSNQGERER